ncbi:unnamed protein product [Acanthoscelides obtectus]|uniref:RNase H type-1 domain-containing protein n=1 Tax=Acanthoscelides obtectus TaxID=200917 RepID=A0A9P0VTX6_ACAOB|nr:unnamed protein product [Acanthoscelides obtectus]CAK1684360.1 hypothetical protein AOBTE_LOCUS34837 [Acanthoscelides obtectus]
MQDLVRQWKDKPLHGRYRSRIEDNAIDTKASQGWLQSGNLFLETEGFIASIQDQYNMQNIKQWNCNGCVSHVNELRVMVRENDPFCIALQETYFRPETSFSLRNYNTYRKDVIPDRRARGGVALLVKQNIIAQEQRLDTELQAVAVRITTPFAATLHINLSILESDNEHTNRPTYTRPARIRSLEFQQANNISIRDVLQRAPYDTPPWTRSKPHIDIRLSVFLKNETAPQVYLARFKQITDHLHDHLFIYSDGSKSSTGVGASIVVNSVCHMWSLDPISSIFTAECYATWQALLFFALSSSLACSIVSDSLSVISSIGNNFTKDERISRILNLTSSLENDHKKVRFIWVPSHVNIIGNELADAAAKQAATMPPDEGIPTPLSDYVKHLKDTTKQAWQHKWDLYDGHMRSVQTSIEKWTYPKQLNRRQQTVLCRLRIGHCKLTHAYLLAGDHRPQCLACQTDLTVQHILVECRLYSDLRRELQMSSNIQTLLKTEWPKVMDFLLRSDTYTKI